MALGSPAILDPRAFDLRAFQGSVKNIRSRIEAIELALTTLIAQINSSSVAGSAGTTQQQLIQINSQINALNAGLRGTEDAVALAASINGQADGILVKIDTNTVVSRTLVEGSQIAINFPDGVDAAPIISYAPTGTKLPLAGSVTIQGYAPTSTVGP